MLNTSRIALAASVLAAFSAVGSVGCAHPQTVTLTSASTVAPPAPAAPIAAEAAVPAPEEAKAPAPKKQDGPMTFEQLSAALGDESSESKMGLDMERSTPTPTGKGLSSDGYSAVGAAHQAVDTGTG